MAHDDLYVSVSLCPAGDFAEDGGHPANHVSWPIKVKTFQDAEGPLCTIPEPERKSIESVDYVMAGFPGMFVGRVGDADSNAYFG